MKTRWLKAGMGAALAVLLLGTNPANPVLAMEYSVQSPAAGGGAAAAAVASKEEVVYASLGHGGAVEGVYVVNQFDVTSAGTLTDHGSYTSVMNLSSTAALSQEGKAVSMPVEAGNFYYQGSLSTKELPWILDITYTLDGQELPAQQLAGQSGALQIHITTAPNPGVDSVFVDNYMLQLSLTLDAENCVDIVSEGATIANAGKSKVVTHTVMPGKNADILVAAQVTDFTMSGIEIAGMPYAVSFDLPDTDEMVDQMSTLADAIAALHDGVGELASGVSELNNGVDKMVSGSADFAGGLNRLNDGSGKFTDGSGQISAALAEIAHKLNNPDAEDSIDLDDFVKLPGALRQMAEGLKTLSGKMAEMKAGYEAMFGQLDAAIMAIPDHAIAEADILALFGALGDPAQQAILNQLVESYAAAQTVKGTYTYVDPATSASIQMGMGAIIAGLQGMADGVDNTVAGLNLMADEMEKELTESDIVGQMEDLATGMQALSDKYAEFHGGLREYTDGVGQLASGYGALHSGLVELHDGTQSLAGGTQDLYAGTGELNDATAELPDTIQVEIDKLLEDYTGQDFTPVSFTSPQNTDVALVQFVLMTGSIEVESEKSQPQESGEEMGVWDRFLALFS